MPVGGVYVCTALLQETLNDSSSQAGCAILDAVQGAKHSKSGALARLCNVAMRQNSHIPAAR